MKLGTKLVFIIMGITCTIMFLSIMHRKERFDFSGLALDQNEAYIAISENDVEGYNRWLPFYFTFSIDADLDERNVEELLNQKIDTAVLYTENGELYRTDQLIWSACRLEKGTYNLTLVIIPELKVLQMDGIINITNIALTSDLGKNIYDISAYFIEERETVKETELYVSLSSMESDILEDFTARVNYGIIKNGNEIQEFALDFPEEYKAVKDYTTINVDRIEDEEEYSVLMRLSENSAGAVFRPFIKIDYGEQKSGFLIPSVPVYFRG